jgi:hypothetical protein
MEFVMGCDANKTPNGQNIENNKRLFHKTDKERFPSENEISKWYPSQMKERCWLPWKNLD